MSKRQLWIIKFNLWRVSLPAKSNLIGLIFFNNENKTIVFLNAKIILQIYLIYSKLTNIFPAIKSNFPKNYTNVFLAILPVIISPTLHILQTNKPNINLT